ncbi:hypothetical protein ISG27_12875 [Burkholderia pseudomallei]|nr:hypothetical protein [Burkholderia pseudomallei]MBF3975064.1 hypothetical protein [Burkholderia pseudomallei]
MDDDLPNANFPATGLPHLRRGTASQHVTFIGEPGEVTVDTTNKTLRVHDGETPGGSPIAGGGGATLFRQLSDAPNSYVGRAGTVPRVKVDESGLEFRAVNRQVKFFDETNNSPSTGLAAPILANAPYSGNAAVGDAIFFGNPNTPADAGIWTIAAITYGTPDDIGTASATLSRRADSELGALFVSGEFIFSTFDGTPHFIEVQNSSGDYLLDGSLDNTTVTLISNDIVNVQSVKAALQQIGIFSEPSSGVGVGNLLVGIGKVAHADSPYQFPPASYSTLPNILLVDATAGDVTITLESADGAIYDSANGLAMPLKIKRVDNSANVVTLNTGNTNVTFDLGTSTTTIAGLAVKTLVFELVGPSWHNSGASVWWSV